jgi:restriction system protein
MPIPNYQQAMIPVLHALADGKPRHRREITEAVADVCNLTASERQVMLPSGNSTIILSRVGWALSYMKHARLVEAPKRGVYQITDRGRQALTERPEGIDLNYLGRFEEFREFYSKYREAASSRRPPDDPSVAETPSVPDESPEEALEAAYARLRATLEADLIDAVKAASPTFFETLVIDLLVRMGYGGSRPEAARAVGKSRDDGIDGVIHEDRLGLDVIYVQAKRWEGSVGRPEVQKFAGALQGHRATKGIFLTTSSFTRDAEEYAQRIDSRIVLIDGSRLATLMVDFDVGVASRASYTVKQMDSDYFEEQ